MIKALLSLPSFQVKEIAFRPVWLPCIPRAGEKVAGDLGVADKKEVDFVVHYVDDNLVNVVLKGEDRAQVKKQIGKNGWIGSSSAAVWPEKK